MSISYKRTNIGEGINLIEVYDKKFKSDYVKISFVSPLKEDTVYLDSLLRSLLVTSNSVYKTKAELSKKLEGLYGAYVGGVYNSLGDYHCMGLVLSFIGDRYTIGGEVISHQAVNELLTCLLKPDIENGSFNNEYFTLRKRELIDGIKANINDKRTYGYMQSEAIAFKGEPSEYKYATDIDAAEKITQADLIARYEYLKRSAAIEILVCGGERSDKAIKLITDALSGLERNNVEKINYRSNSPLKSEVCKAAQEMPVSQCKLYMVYKSDYEDIYVCKTLQMLLGGSPFSKLFVNVREKLSLCYYCAANYRELKGTMIIDSGVERENLQMAENAVTQQLEAICAGDFTDEELYNTKLYMCGLYKSNYDTVADTAGWFERQNIRGTLYTPEQQSELVMNVTRDEVIECAKSFKLDSVYVLKSKEAAE